ncbi:FAD-binding protein [Leeia sp. TBRC 13508]|uniref:FAD-binding protein n=1 Tax=Leeia speluncae TaxID=2884804 RepID=A0ABS8DB05_9NEIS|nr:FAD-binding protein [Leeia speluncae]MCB6185096.1 FAD-binding protein [Leeia speluncae]
MAVLVIADHNNVELNAATRNAVTAALELSSNVSVLVTGYQCQAVVDQVAKIEGVGQVLVASHPSQQHFLAENQSLCISSIAKEFSHVVAPATSMGKSVMPRVAAQLDVQQITEITKIFDENTFERPIYAGNAFIKLVSSDAIKVITVRATKFVSAIDGNNVAPTKDIEANFDAQLSKFIGAESSKSDKVELTTAKVVVSGGRGLASEENFGLIHQLAEKLNAGVGASRAAVDAGFAPSDCQVGQTGKVVAPDVYIAIGMSGAIQHLAGMKDSKMIIAINKDPDAPIFQVADIGMVGDLFEVVPEMIAKLA